MADAVEATEPDEKLIEPIPEPVDVELAAVVEAEEEGDPPQATPAIEAKTHAIVPVRPAPTLASLWVMASQGNRTRGLMREKAWPQEPPCRQGQELNGTGRPYDSASVR